MYIPIFSLYLLCYCVSAALIVPSSNVTSKMNETTTSPLVSVNTSATIGPDFNTTTQATNTSKLLREKVHFPPLRGRVILANTRLEGSDEWGVSATQAEVACDRIARYQSQTVSPTSLLYRLWKRLLPVSLSQKNQPMEGHLLSIGSSYEVMELSRLLHPLPEGSYWTGGQLTRYRVNSMRTNTYTDHIIFTWTDGRIGKRNVLGMTKLDELQLREGYTYCLALNLREMAWQARDCADQLPYACLITPRKMNFYTHDSKASDISSNIASVKTAEKPTKPMTNTKGGNVYDTQSNQTTPSPGGTTVGITGQSLEGQTTTVEPSSTNGLLSGTTNLATDSQSFDYTSTATQDLIQSTTPTPEATETTQNGLLDEETTSPGLSTMTTPVSSTTMSLDRSQETETEAEGVRETEMPESTSTEAVPTESSTKQQETETTTSTEGTPPSDNNNDAKVEEE